MCCEPRKACVQKVTLRAWIDHIKVRLKLSTNKQATEHGSKKVNKCTSKQVRGMNASELREHRAHSRKWASGPLAEGPGQRAACRESACIANDIQGAPILERHTSKPRSDWIVHWQRNIV